MRELQIEVLPDSSPYPLQVTIQSDLTRIKTTNPPEYEARLADWLARNLTESNKKQILSKLLAERLNRPRKKYPEAVETIEDLLSELEVI